jgi:hypothetical protein
MGRIKPHLHAQGKMKLKEPRRAPVGGWYYKYVITRNNLDFPATVYGERQPAERCWMGAGDHVAQAIHGVARVVDKIAGTRLEQKAKGCSSCQRRRQTLNSFFKK